MPLNCPAAIAGPCAGCRSRTEDDRCSYYQPSVSVREILTPDERIDELEAQITSFEQFVPSVVITQLTKRADHMLGLLNHLQNRLNEHLDIPKKTKKRPAASKGLDIG